MTFEQFAREMRFIGEELPTTLSQQILNAAYIVVEQVKSHPSISGTKLKNLIEARLIDDDFLGISMPEYGFYLNYGVQGLKNSTEQFGVKEPDAQFLGVSEGYKFRFGTGNSARNEPPKYWGIHYPGIQGRQFFDVEEIIDQVTQIVNQNLEL